MGQAASPGTQCSPGSQLTRSLTRSFHICVRDAFPPILTSSIAKNRWETHPFRGHHAWTHQHWVPLCPAVIRQVAIEPSTANQARRFFVAQWDPKMRLAPQHQSNVKGVSHFTVDTRWRRCSCKLSIDVKYDPTNLDWLKEFSTKI